MEITVHVNPVDVITSIELKECDLDELGFKDSDLADNNEGERFIWKRDSTFIFLGEYRKRLDKFRDPKVKKKTLWGDIQNVMNVYGYVVDADALDRKMRNMKCTFNKIKENNKKRSKGRRIHWEFYNMFSEMFAENETNHLNSSELLSLDIADELLELSSSDRSPPIVETTTTLACSVKALEIFHKRKIEAEENKLEELKKMRMAVEACNKINRDKLNIFRKYVDKQRKYVD